MKNLMSGKVLFSKVMIFAIFALILVSVSYVQVGYATDTSTGTMTVGLTPGSGYVPVSGYTSYTGVDLSSSAASEIYGVTPEGAVVKLDPDTNGDKDLHFNDAYSAGTYLLYVHQTAGGWLKVTIIHPSTVRNSAFFAQLATSAGTMNVGLTPGSGYAPAEGYITYTGVDLSSAGASEIYGVTPDGTVVTLEADIHGDKDLHFADTHPAGTYILYVHQTAGPWLKVTIIHPSTVRNSAFFAQLATSAGTMTVGLTPGSGYVPVSGYTSYTGVDLSSGAASEIYGVTPEGAVVKLDPDTNGDKDLHFNDAYSAGTYLLYVHQTAGGWLKVTIIHPSTVRNKAFFDSLYTELGTMNVGLSGSGYVPVSGYTSYTGVDLSSGAASEIYGVNPDGTVQQLDPDTNGDKDLHFRDTKIAGTYLLYVHQTSTGIPWVKVTIIHPCVSSAVLASLTTSAGTMTVGLSEGSGYAPAEGYITYTGVDLSSAGASEIYGVTPDGTVVTLEADIHGDKDLHFADTHPAGTYYLYVHQTSTGIPWLKVTIEKTDRSYSEFLDTLDTLPLTTTLNGDGTLRSGTVSDASEVSTTSNGIITTLDIPAGTVITGFSTWDGTLTLPTATTTFTLTPDPGNTAVAVLAIEIGAGDIALTFDQAVKLTFVGQASNFIGWSRGGVFTQITTPCDSLINPTLTDGADCKITDGSDLVVWTKHFTSFITYTQTPIPPAPAPTGGGGGGCTLGYTMTSPASVDGTAGSSVTVPVTVTDTGTCSGSVTVTASVPTGWTATSATTNLLGAANPSQTVNIIMTIPADATTSAIAFSGAVSGQTYTSATTVNIPAAATPAVPPATEQPLQPTTPGLPSNATTPTGLAVASPETTAGIIIVAAIIVVIVAYAIWRRQRKKKKM